MFVVNLSLLLSLVFNLFFAGHAALHELQTVKWIMWTRARSNVIDIEVSRHHTSSVSNFQSIKLSTDDWIVIFYRYSWIPLIDVLNLFDYSHFNNFFQNIIISSFSLYIYN